MTSQTELKTPTTKPPHATGYALLHDPRLNKGTAFTEAERRAWGIEGLLPPAVLPIEMQVARRHDEIARLDNDLQKYLVLSDLQARNETLFYAVLMSDPATYMPLVYTPTSVRRARNSDTSFVSRVAPICRSAREVGSRSSLSNWPEKDVRFIVVTDGERILGLGDLGAGGMGIPLGKLALYTACAGVPPQYCLPIVLDVGTNNQSLARRPALSRPAAKPRARRRVSWPSSTSLSRRSRSSIRSAASNGRTLRTSTRCRSWRAIATRFARSMTISRAPPASHSPASLPPCASPRQKLTDQRFLFLGAGSAATGIAELISQAMARDGMDLAEARRRNALFDINGLLVTSRTDLADFQKPFAQDRTPVSTFVEAVKALRPTGIIGVSTVPKLFNREVIEAMAEINERPIIFPYSNPTSRSECTAEEAYRWSDGRAIFASGSPFPPVEIAGRRFVPGQGNNVYIFPAMGMAVFATEANRVTEEMFIVAAHAVAEQVSEENLAMGLIYPPQSQIFEASLHVAERIATYIFDKGLAQATRPHGYQRADPSQSLPSRLFGVGRMA